MCGRGIHEKVYRELKGGFAFDCLTALRYDANSTWQVFSIISFNLMRSIAGRCHRAALHEWQTTCDLAASDHPDLAV